MPEALGIDQLFESSEVADKDGFIAVNELVRKTEQADLLDHILVDHESRIIVHFAAVNGAAAHVVEVLAAVDEVDDCRRNGNRDDQPRCCRENCRHGNNVNDNGDDCGNDRKEALQNVNRTVACFTVGVFQPFVEFGIVKGGKVDFFCFFDDGNLDLIGDKLARDAVQNVVDVLDDAVDDQIAEL